MLQTHERGIIPNLLMAHLIVTLVDVAFSGVPRLPQQRSRERVAVLSV